MRRRERNVRLAIILGCLAAALAITACGSSKSKSSSTAGATSAPTATTGTGPKGGLPLQLTDFKFQPSRIKGQGGHQLTLELKNTGSTEHNFSVDAQHISKDVEKGEDAKVTITVPPSGTVQFYCKYHKKSYNMVGSIAVGGASAPKATPTNTNTGGGGSGY
jgi:plastocyanin